MHLVNQAQLELKVHKESLVYKGLLDYLYVFFNKCTIYCFNLLCRVQLVREENEVCQDLLD